MVVFFSSWRTMKWKKINYIYNPIYKYIIYIYIHTHTEQSYKCNTFVFAPIFHELNSKIYDFFYLQKRPISLKYCLQICLFGMLWIGVYDSMFQFLPISSNFAQPLKRSGSTFHRPQSTTWSTLCEGGVFHCAKHMVATPDTDWFSDPTGHPNTVKLHILELPFIVASVRHTCAIIMLSNQHLDMLHLWGGWIILGKGEVLTNTDLDRFVNNIWEK